MNKKALTERDICSKFINPAICKAGWDFDLQVREEHSFTAGRIKVLGKLHTRGKVLRADYILYHQPNLPLAVIEAKDNNHRVGDGMQQALEYAVVLDAPFVFSSNGDGFKFHDRTGNAKCTETEITLDEFPSPSELWKRYCKWKQIDKAVESFVETPYYSDNTGKSPRYYQSIAINRSIEAIAKGQNRLLLVMATGTGKTYTAFQIMWRLWKAKKKKRILFLADRNFLVDHAKTGDFKPFGKIMTKITKRRADPSYEVYLSLYQAITGKEEAQKTYKLFSPQFFDLVVVDECHRSSASEDSSYREILEYFSSATQIGLTATPKETKDISNIGYFGEPIYTYSLKQGIEDGFLAPYKVIRIDFDKDLQGWRPEHGKLDKHGNLINDRIFNQKDFDTNLVLEKRTELVAQKITEFLKASNPFNKTIVFCDDIDHAERMRSYLVNLNSERVAEDSRYVMRITGDDKQGKAQLDNFIAPEERYPVIATTSDLMTTGLDAKTCKLIVLDKHITSPTEFKQIIGRGTRIDEEFDKFWFTIMDFKKATDAFADPNFDGNPERVDVFNYMDTVLPIDEPSVADDKLDDTAYLEAQFPDNLEQKETVKKIKFVVNDVAVKIVDERVQYYGADGRLITESIRDYTRSCVIKQFASLDDFLRKWSHADVKKVIIEELAEEGVLWEPLCQEVERKLGKQFDPFDLVCHVAFDQPALSRRERADNVRKRNYFTKYGVQARRVIDALLDKYADTGIENIEDLKVLQLEPFAQMGTAPEIVKYFGGKSAYLKALKELEDLLYA